MTFFDYDYFFDSADLGTLTGVPAVDNKLKAKADLAVGMAEEVVKNYLGVTPWYDGDTCPTAVQLCVLKYGHLLFLNKVGLKKYVTGVTTYFFDIPELPVYLKELVAAYVVKKPTQYAGISVT